MNVVFSLTPTFTGSKFVQCHMYEGNILLCSCEFAGSGGSYAGIQNGKMSNAVDLNRILNVLGNEYNVCSACNSRSTASHGQITSAASGVLPLVPAVRCTRSALYPDERDDF